MTHLDRIGLVALGFMLGVFACSAGMTYSAIHYDEQLRVFDTLRKKYGAKMERKPSP